MNWLNRLLGVEGPADASLRSAELGFRGPSPGWLAALLLLLLAAGIFFLYARERARIGVVRRALMALLRTAAVALLVLLLFRPVLLAEFQGRRAQGIALLLD